MDARSIEGTSDVKTLARKITLASAAAALALGAAACEIDDDGGLDDPGLDDPGLEDPLLEDGDGDL